MPKLLVFAACLKGIQDQSDGTVSLISLMEGIGIGLTSPEETPDEAFVPFPLNVLALFQQTPDDDGKTYEVRLYTKYPNGDESEGGISKVEIRARLHRQFYTVQQLKIGRDLDGERILTLAIRDANNASNWTIIGEYPILITYEYQGSNSHVAPKDA